MQVEMKHLDLIRVLAEEGTLTAAGNKLHLTQPALSQQLRSLEESLGVQLFIRQGRRMRITPAGQRILHAAWRVHQELQQAEDDIRNLRSGIKGVLRISAECYTCYQWLAPIVRDFNEKYPEVDVRIAADSGPEPVAPLREDKIDLAIASGRSPAGLAVTDLFEDELVAVIPQNHALASKDWVDIEDFTDQHLLLYTPSENVLVRDLLGPAGIHPARVSHIELTEASIELVKAGLGITVMADWTVAKYANQDGIVCRRLTEHGTRRHWKAVTVRDHGLPHLDRFVSILKKEGTLFAGTAQ